MTQSTIKQIRHEWEVANNKTKAKPVHPKSPAKAVEPDFALTAEQWAAIRPAPVVVPVVKPELPKSYIPAYGDLSAFERGARDAKAARDWKLDAELKSTSAVGGARLSMAERLAAL